MSAHREHPFISEIEAQERGPRLRIHPSVLLVMGTFAVSVAVTLPFTLGIPVAKSTAIEQPPITAMRLPPASGTQDRTLQLRLEDWRSGYEAAVENGCQLRPLLNRPVGRP